MLGTVGGSALHHPQSLSLDNLYIQVQEYAKSDIILLLAPQFFGNNVSLYCHF